MMIKPGISDLSKCVDSRYTLVTMAAKRARMIGEERMHDMDAYGDDNVARLYQGGVEVGDVAIKGDATLLHPVQCAFVAADKPGGHGSGGWA